MPEPTRHSLCCSQPEHGPTLSHQMSQERNLVVSFHCMMNLFSLSLFSMAILASLMANPSGRASDVSLVTVCWLTAAVSISGGTGSTDLPWLHEARKYENQVWYSVSSQTCRKRDHGSFDFYLVFSRETTRGQTPIRVDAPWVCSAIAVSTLLDFLTNPDNVIVSNGWTFISCLLVDLTTPMRLW